MSIQTIINNATGIAIGRKPVVAQTFSRSQQIRTSQRGPRIWTFVVTMHNGLRYSINRGVLEQISHVDRLVETQISLADSPGMNYITRYLGALTQTELNQIQVSNWDVGSELITISNLPTVDTNTVLFAAGDLIQPSDSRYPYTVTGNVVRGSGNSITLQLHRGRVNEPGYDPVGRNLLVGSAVTWRVIATQIPDFTIEAGDLINWSGEFVLVESIL